MKGGAWGESGVGCLLSRGWIPFYLLSRKRWKELGRQDNLVPINKWERGLRFPIESQILAQVLAP